MLDFIENSSILIVNNIEETLNLMLPKYPLHSVRVIKNEEKEEKNTGAEAGKRTRNRNRVRAKGTKKKREISPIGTKTPVCPAEKAKQGYEDAFRICEKRSRAAKPF